MERITPALGQEPLKYSHAIKSALRTPGLADIHQDVFVFAYSPPFTRKKADEIAPVWLADLEARSVFADPLTDAQRAAIISSLSDRLFSDWYSVKIKDVTFYADTATMVSVDHSHGALAGYEPERVRFYA